MDFVKTIIVTSLVILGGSAVYGIWSAQRPPESLEPKAAPTPLPTLGGTTWLQRFQELTRRSAVERWPYRWGGGGPGRLQETATDCTGYVTNILYAMGIVDGRERINLEWLRLHATPVQEGLQQPGDVAGWPGHVELVYGYPNPSNDVLLIGSSGQPGTPSAGVKFKMARTQVIDGRLPTFWRIAEVDTAMHSTEVANV